MSICKPIKFTGSGPQIRVVFFFSFLFEENSHFSFLFQNLHRKYLIILFYCLFLLQINLNRTNWRKFMESKLGYPKRKKVQRCKTVFVYVRMWYLKKLCENFVRKKAKRSKQVNLLEYSVNVFWLSIETSSINIAQKHTNSQLLIRKRKIRIFFHCVRVFAYFMSLFSISIYRLIDKSWKIVEIQLNNIEATLRNNS